MCREAASLLDLAAAGLAIAARSRRSRSSTTGCSANTASRGRSSSSGLSAGPADYFHVAGGAWTWGGLLPIGRGELELFHGFVVLAFAAIGAATIGRGRCTQVTRLVATYLAIAALASGSRRAPGRACRTAAVQAAARLQRASRPRPPVLGLRSSRSRCWRAPGSRGCWRVSRSAAAAVAAVLIAATILVEGQHGVGLTDTPNPKERSWDAVAYDWLRASPPGGVIELDVTQLDDLRPFTHRVPVPALMHRHPIVNGYGGWKSTLQELFGSYASPLREPGLTADALRGLRAIGVRYMLVHAATFPNPDEPARAVAEIRAASDQVAEEHEWPGVWAWRLKDIEAAAPARR